jgi:hypothetical protein
MKTAFTSLALLSLLLVACGGTGESDNGGDGAAGKAGKAAAIADAIASNPAQMESILEKHGMTTEEFEALLYEISEDETLSNAYEAARKVPTPE